MKIVYNNQVYATELDIGLLLGLYHSFIKKYISEKKTLITLYLQCQNFENLLSYFI